jgi:broad specificity phosphatase PhoE
MNLYLVRHGLTDWNVSGHYQGWGGPDLNLVGLVQARQTAAFFTTYQAQRSITFAALYSSPTVRTWRTALLIGRRLGLLPDAVPDLREMRGGAIEGLTEGDWQARYPHLTAAWQDPANLDFGWPGGETRRAFRARCRRAVAGILARHQPDDHVLVVTHGGLIKAYLEAAALDDPPGSRAYEVDNCSITHVQFTANSTAASSVVWSIGCLQTVNDVRHLHADPAPPVGASAAK